MDHNVNFPDVEELKNHVKWNKKFYIGLGLGILIGLASRRSPQIITTIHVPPFA
jgi:hypothetical protein